MGLAFRVERLSLAHPNGIWHLVVNKSNTLTYVVCTFGIHGKTYGIKNSIANATNVVATYIQITIIT
jgi:hypothetical protein